MVHREMLRTAEDMWYSRSEQPRGDRGEIIPVPQGLGDSKSKGLIGSDFPGLIPKPPFPVRLSLRGLHISPSPRTFEIFRFKNKENTCGCGSND